MAGVTHVKDYGWNKIKREIQRAKVLEVVVGVQVDSYGKHGETIAEYAFYNEYGTKKIPERSFMRTAFDENKGRLSERMAREYGQVIAGKKTVADALAKIGEVHQRQIQNIINKRDILPKLSELTVKRKKGDTKTLIDTGALHNTIKYVVRPLGSVGKSVVPE